MKIREVIERDLANEPPGEHPVLPGGGSAGQAGDQEVVRAALADDPILAEIVRRLVDELEPERVYLFGSRARGEAGAHSDYDLLVVVASSDEPSYRVARRAHSLLWDLGTAADIPCGRGRRSTAAFTSRRRFRQPSSGKGRSSMALDAARADDTRAWLRKAREDLRATGVKGDPVRA